MRLRCIALLFLASCAGLVLAQSRAPDIPDDQTIADAYVYLLGRMLVMRQERNDLKEPGASYNKVRYHPLGSTDLANPNLDVASLEAWLAVDERTPVIVEVPQICGDDRCQQPETVVFAVAVEVGVKSRARGNVQPARGQQRRAAEWPFGYDVHDVRPFAGPQTGE